MSRIFFRLAPDASTGATTVFHMSDTATERRWEKERENVAGNVRTDPRCLSPCSWRYPVVKILSDNRRRIVRRKRSRAPLRYRTASPLSISPLFVCSSSRFAYVRTYVRSQGRICVEINETSASAVKRDPVGISGPRGETLSEILSPHFTLMESINTAI